MEQTEKYVIDLREMQADTAAYRFVLDDAFFAYVDGPEVSRGLVDAELTVRRLKDIYKLNFKLSGSIKVVCDRCLDDMDLPIDTTDSLTVKLGSEVGTEGDDDVVFVDEEDGTIDVAWPMYEFIALSIPIQHVHPEGQCNAVMSAKLNELRRRSDEETDGGEDANRTIDPRWEKLKDIDNN